MSDNPQPATANQRPAAAMLDPLSAMPDPHASVRGDQRSVVVIGYGNDLRGDDAAGMRVAAAVATWRIEGVRVVAVRQLTPELAEILAMARLAIFIDACPIAGSTSDDCHAPQTNVRPLTLDPSVSSLGHTSDPCRLLALAQALYGAHPQAWLVAVPAKSFQLGAALSPTAAAGVSAALHEIRTLIRSQPCTKLD